MEEKKLTDLDAAELARHRGIRILDIAGDQLPTFIRLGYAPAGMAATIPAIELLKPARNGSVKSKRRNPTLRSDARDVPTWRGWRSKMPFGDISRNFVEDEASRSVNRKHVSSYSDNWQMPHYAVRNRHFKHQPSNVNMLNYNGMYNNMYNGLMTTHHPSSLHNGSSRSGSHTKKYYERPHLCQQIKSNVCLTFKDYCDHCTIHGLKYIGDTSLSHMERVFWILSFLLAIMGAAYFIWHLYAKFQMSPIIISRSSDTVSIDQFPFPAVTVCNMNNAKKSVARQIIKGNDSLQKFYLEDICDFKNDTPNFQNEVFRASGNWENIYQFLLNVSQSCSQMLYFCQWQGNITNCTDIFNPVLTDEGLCCRFNSVPDILYDPRVWENLEISYASDQRIDWTPEYKFTKDDSPSAIPWRTYASGSNYGLTLALDVNADEYYCSSTASVGFKMLLHSPVETPQIADFAFTLSPGKETRVIITPHITDADKSIIKIPPKIRHCYFLSEKKLRYYRTYTQRNCVLECEANFTLKFCQCMQYYMPVTNDTRICGKNDDDCCAVARRIMQNKLYEDDDSRAAYNITEAPSCKCYPGCNEINYSTEISQSMLMTTFIIPEEFYKHYDEYFEKNIAVVHIFFIDSSYMKYTKNELYGFAELLSNTGGLLGLFMGFSLLSVTEIFYYFSIRLWWRICKGRAIKNDKNKFIIQTFSKKHNVYPFAQ